MAEAFANIKRRLSREIDCDCRPETVLLKADPWIVSSLLQKSIRRGETEIAQQATLTFLALKGSAIWRRLMVIAFEDIGAGSADLLAATVAAGTDSAWRKETGGDVPVALDPRSRVAAVFMAQLLPFADDRALRIYRQFERGVYAAVKAD